MIVHTQNSNCVQLLAQSLTPALTHQSILTLYSQEMELHGDDEPTSLYTDRAYKRRILPCVECGEPVNGVRTVRQCTGHLHRTCGTSQQPGFRSAGAVCAFCSGEDMSLHQSQIVTQVMSQSPNRPHHPAHQVRRGILRRRHLPRCTPAVTSLSASVFMSSTSCGLGPQ